MIVYCMYLVLSCSCSGIPQYSPSRQWEWLPPPLPERSRAGFVETRMADESYQPMRPTCTCRWEEAREGGRRGREGGEGGREEREVRV